MRIKNYCLLIFLLIIILSGCKDVNPTPTQTGSALDHLNRSTATPTNAVVFPTDEPGILAPDGGEVDVHIPFKIYAPGEVNNTEGVECVKSIPFHFYIEEMRTLMEGQAPIDCFFEDTPQDYPITFHVIFDFDCELNGKLFPATIDKPEGMLDAFMMVDGAITQFYTGNPSEAVNPCPESAPCSVPVTENIPLPFTYQESSTINTPWTFILHLK